MNSISWRGSLDSARWSVGLTGMARHSARVPLGLSASTADKAAVITGLLPAAVAAAGSERLPTDP